MNVHPRAVVADSYLNHILIAVVASDHAAPFRDFLDNWFAFERGPPFLTSGGRPVWFNNPCAVQRRELLQSMHFISQEARDILDRAYADPKSFVTLRTTNHPSTRLMVDHVIPLRVLRHRLFNDMDLNSPERVKAYLIDHYRFRLLYSTKRCIKYGNRSLYNYV